ncbi:putative reverse transcriptase domain-containing protein, partial [Tanacetum coccineum]
FYSYITGCMGKDDVITTLLKSILDGSALRFFGHGGGDFLEERATGNTNIKKCLGKVADEHFTPAVKVLSSSGIAPYYDDTIKALEAKHPYKPPPSKPSITFFEHPLVAEIDSVFEGSATATDLLKVITSVVNLWLAGRRLVSKVSVKGVGKEISKYLSDFQFGVGVSGAVEAVLHSVNRASKLYIGDTHIWSTTRVHQGDPLGPLLFAFILHPLLHKIKDSCKLILHASYLDDGTVIGDSEEVAKVLDIINVSCTSLGLELNIKKTEI